MSLPLCRRSAPSARFGMCERGIGCSFVSVGVVGSKGEYEFMNDGREGSRTGRREGGQKVEC